MQSKLIELPHDPEAEKALIGSILFGPEEIPKVVEHVGGDDFVSDEGGTLFKIIRDKWSKAQPVDGILLRSAYEGRANENDLLNYQYEAENSMCHAVNAVYYAKIVRRKSVERQLIKLVDETRSRITDPGEDLDDKLAAIGQLLSACPGTVEKKDITLTDLIDDYFLRSDRAAGIPTGFPHLDRLTDGLKRGQLILVGGPSSIGKSSLITDFFIHAMRLGVNPYLVSLEMFNDEIAERMIRNIARVPSGFDLNDPNVIEAGQFIGKWPGSLAEKRDPDIDALCTQVLSKRQRDQIGIAFIRPLAFDKCPRAKPLRADHVH